MTKHLPTDPIAVLTEKEIYVSTAKLEHSNLKLYQNGQSLSEVRDSQPHERRSITYQFEDNTHPAFLIVGLDENNAPVELLLHLPYANQQTARFCDLFCNMASALLQSDGGLVLVINQLKKSPLDITGVMARFLETKFGSEAGSTVDSLSHPIVVELENNQ